MDLFSGYDQMLLGQTETEINEPTTQQNGEMPSPFESQAVEEDTFNHLKNGGGMFDGMGQDTPVAAGAALAASAGGTSAGVQMQAKTGIPPVLIYAAVAFGLLYFLGKKN
jgi:hypothetical protein